MHLSPKEIEKLVLHNAGFLAQKRLARGVLLNYPEAVALIAAQILEFIREGASVAELMDRGKRILGFADVLPGVASMVGDVQVEGTFADGVKLVTVHEPICSEHGSEELALHGSGLSRKTPAPASDSSPAAGVTVPGEYFLAPGNVVLNADRETVSLEVANTGDRPIQVGSHYPFFETNAALRFDRSKAYGFRLDIPSGTAVRFEPGESRAVNLVRIAGEEIIRGGNALIAGKLSESNRMLAMDRVAQQNFNHQSES